MKKLRIGIMEVPLMFVLIIQKIWDCSMSYFISRHASKIRITMLYSLCNIVYVDFIMYFNRTSNRTLRIEGCKRSEMTSGLDWNEETSDSYEKYFKMSFIVVKNLSNITPNISVVKFWNYPKTLRLQLLVCLNITDMPVDFRVS